MASFTLAKLPLPMVLSNRYFPMCGSSEVRRDELRTDADALPELPPPPPPPPLLPSDPFEFRKKKKLRLSTIHHVTSDYWHANNNGGTSRVNFRN